MAIGQLQKRKTGTLTDLANPGNYENNDPDNDLGNQFLRAGLFPIAADGTILIDSNIQGFFYLNPSTWEESKTANWAQNQIPGQSDPVLQWVSSGARTLTFDALITADTSNYPAELAETESEKAKPQKVVEKVASYASKLFKVQVPPPRNTQPTKNIEVLDISDTLNYYRSLLYPEYTNQSNGPGRLQRSPPLLALFAGKSISRLPHGTKITTSSDVWVLTDLRIRITKQLKNLAPMEATVTFTLLQYNIRSSDARKFHIKG